MLAISDEAPLPEVKSYTNVSSSSSSLELELELALLNFAFLNLGIAIGGGGARINCPVGKYMRPGGGGARKDILWSIVEADLGLGAEKSSEIETELCGQS